MAWLLRNTVPIGGRGLIYQEDVVVCVCVCERRRERERESERSGRSVKGAEALPKPQSSFSLQGCSSSSQIIFHLRSEIVQRRGWRRWRGTEGRVGRWKDSSDPNRGRWLAEYKWKKGNKKPISETMTAFSLMISFMIRWFVTRWMTLLLLLELASELANLVMPSRRCWKSCVISWLALEVIYEQ